MTNTQQAQHKKQHNSQGPDACLSTLRRHSRPDSVSGFHTREQIQCWNVDDVNRPTDLVVWTTQLHSVLLSLCCCPWTDTPSTECCSQNKAEHCWQNRVLFTKQSRALFTKQSRALFTKHSTVHKTKQSTVHKTQSCSQNKAEHCSQNRVLFTKQSRALLTKQSPVHKTEYCSQNKAEHCWQNSPVHKTKHSSQNRVMFTKQSRALFTKQSPVHKTKQITFHKTKSSSQNKALFIKHSPVHKTKQSTVHKTESCSQNKALFTKQSPVHKTKQSIVHKTKQNTVHKTKQSSQTKTLSQNTAAKPLKKNLRGLTQLAWHSSLYCGQTHNFFQGSKEGNASTLCTVCYPLWSCCTSSAHPYTSTQSPLSTNVICKQICIESGESTWCAFLAAHAFLSQRDLPPLSWPGETNHDLQLCSTLVTVSFNACCQCETTPNT